MKTHTSLLVIRLLAIVIAVSVLALFLAVAIAWGSAAARESADRLPKGSRKSHRAAH